LTFTGEKNVRYLIEATTNLIEWKPLLTLLDATGTLEFADPEASNFAYHFYRARRLD